MNKFLGLDRFDIIKIISEGKNKPENTDEIRYIKDEWNHVFVPGEMHKVFNGKIEYAGRNEHFDKQKKKDQKKESISRLTVDVGNKTFDANDESQTRMANTIKALEISGKTETDWKLANGKIKKITLNELKEAFVLSAETLSALVLST